MSEFTSCDNCVNDDTFGFSDECVDCKYRIYDSVDNFKSNLKIIDMSAVIKSGIDVELSMPNDSISIGKLSEISNKVFYCENSQICSEMCKVRSNHWHYWNGGECPLPKGLMIEARMRDGRMSEQRESSLFGWQHSLGESDIIAFKVVGVAKGWKYGTAEEVESICTK